MKVWASRLLGRLLGRRCRLFGTLRGRVVAAAKVSRLDYVPGVRV